METYMTPPKEIETLNIRLVDPWDNDTLYDCILDIQDTVNELIDGYNQLIKQNEKRD